jgi:MoaA/NifB/PqqE/SkfB family radical SAM enzyme
MNPKILLKLANRWVFRKKPVYAHFGITHRCNLQCRMCGIERDAQESQELSLEQIGRVFDNLKDLGVVYVSIGGGEPFLRKDLLPVIKLLIKKGFMIRLLTNGTLMDEKSVRDLALAGLREISVSLDTLDPDKFTQICGQGKFFETIMNNLDTLSNVLPKDNRLILINTVVSPLNVKELPRLAEFAVRKGFYISFIPVESGGLADFTFKQGDNKEIDDSYDYLIRMKRKSKSPLFNSSMFLDKSRRYLKSGECGWQCDAGKLYFSLSPEGELSICHKFNKGVSLLQPGIKNVSVLKAAREDLIKVCPGCMRPCWAEISFLFKNTASLLEMCRVKL